MDTEEDVLPPDNQQEKSFRRLLTVILELMDRLQRSRGVFFALGVAASSTALNILSYLAGETIHPSMVTLWISVTEVLLLTTYLIITRPAPPRHVKTVCYLVLGSLFTGCGSMSLLVGIMISDPADVVTILFTMPVILIILEAIIKKQKTKILHLIFTICSIVGVVFVTKPSFLFNRNSDVNIWGMFFGLLSAFSHAGGMITMRELAESTLHPIILCLGTSITIWTISISFCYFHKCILLPSEAKLVLVLLAAGVSHFGSCTLVYLALAVERPFIVSIIMTFEITFTFLAQWLTLNMAPSWYSAIGGLLITVSCIGVALTKDEENRNSNEREEENLLHE